jgi:hypothetical protein
MSLLLRYAEQLAAPQAALRPLGAVRRSAAAIANLAVSQPSAVVLALALASRAYAGLVAAVTVSVAPVHWPYGSAALVMRQAASFFARSSPLHYLVNPWTNWDGAWFVGVAQHGYSRAGSAAFLPLYPLLIRAGTPLGGGHYAVVAVLLSVLFFLVACLLLYRLVAADFTPAVALWSVTFLAIFPSSLFFQAAYSESLFLLLSVACFYWSRRGRFWLAGLAGAAAALTRNTGVILVLPMALYYLEAHGWRLRRVDRVAASLLLVPAGLAAYLAYLWARLGDPLAFLHVQTAWRRAPAFPALTVYRGAVAFGRGLYALAAGHASHAEIHNVIAFALLAIALALLVVGWRRLPAPYTAYALVAIVLPLCYPTDSRPLLSMARFVAVIFPLQVSAAGGLAQHSRARLATAVASLVGLGTLVVLFAEHVFVG